jgi:hypothetical protein
MLEVILGGLSVVLMIPIICTVYDIGEQDGQAFRPWSFWTASR